MTALIVAIAQVATALLLFYILFVLRETVWILKTVQSHISDIHTVIVDERTIQHGLPRGVRGLSGHIVNALQNKEVQILLSETIQDAFTEMGRTEAASKAFRNRPNSPKE